MSGRRKQQQGRRNSRKCASISMVYPYSLGLITLEDRHSTIEWCQEVLGAVQVLWSKANAVWVLKWMPQSSEYCRRYRSMWALPLLFSRQCCMGPSQSVRGTVGSTKIYVSLVILTPMLYGS